MSLSPEAFFNFAVTKRSKQGRGKDQHRIISFDFKHKKMYTINKEKITKTFTFEDFLSYDRHGLYVEIKFKTKSVTYACTFQSKDDCDMFVDLVDAQVNQRTFDPSPYERTVLARGHVLKYKKGMFQRRFLVLVPGKLFVFGPSVGSASRWQYPRNILALDQTSYSKLDDGLSFNLRYGANGDDRIGFLTRSESERASWIKSLQEGSRRHKKDPKKQEEEQAKAKAEADAALAAASASATGDGDDDSDGDDSSGLEEGVVEEAGAAEGSRVRVASLVDLTSDDPPAAAAPAANQTTAPADNTPSDWVTFDDNNNSTAQGMGSWATFDDQPAQPAATATPAAAPAAQPAAAPAAQPAAQPAAAAPVASNNPFVGGGDPAVSPRGPAKSEADWVSFEVVSPPRPKPAQPAAAPAAAPAQQTLTTAQPFDLLYPMRQSIGNQNDDLFGGQAHVVPVDLTKQPAPKPDAKQFELYKEMDASALYSSLSAS